MKRRARSKPSSQRQSVREFQRQAEKKADRRLKARKEKKYSLWRGLGVSGIVGWSVILPTLLGLAIGLWVGSAVLALVLMLVGLGLGSLNAWYWVVQESQDE